MRNIFWTSWKHSRFLIRFFPEIYWKRLETFKNVFKKLICLETFGFVLELRSFLKYPAFPENPWDKYDFFLKTRLKKSSQFRKFLEYKFRGNHFKLKFQTFFKISRLFADLPYNLETARSIKYLIDFLRQTCTKQVIPKSFQIEIIRILKFFYCILRISLKNSVLFACLPDNLETAGSIKKK